jgi:hypothetical protein
MPDGGAIYATDPIDEVLVDGYLDFEKMLDRLDGIK